MADKFEFPGKLEDTEQKAPGGKLDSYHVGNIIEQVFTRKRAKKELKDQNFKFYNANYLVKTFGLKGFEFGKWVSQEDRYIHLAAVAFSMKDFCDVFKLPYNKFGLGNKITIAIGARGNPGALAHFEPHTFAINISRHRDLYDINQTRYAWGAKPLTPEQYEKMKHTTSGAGSFGHEYGHALDCFAALKIDTGLNWNFESEVIKSAITYFRTDYKNGKKSDKPENQTNLYQLDVYPTAKPEVRANAFAVMFKLMYKKSSKNSYYIATDFYKKLLDKHKNKKLGEYWLRPVEIWARSFESFLSYELSKAGIQESYLQKNKYYYFEGGKSYLYPSEEQIKEVAPYFRKFIKKVYKVA